MKRSVKPLLRRGIVLLVFLLISSVFISAAYAVDSPEITITVVPETVQIARQEKAIAYVLVKNGSDTKLENVKLCVESDTDLLISNDTANAGVELSPSEVQRWRVDVEAPETGKISGVIYLLVDYEYEIEGQSGEEEEPVTGEGAAVESLKVESLDALNLEDILTVELKKADANLVEFQPRDVLLVVTNDSDEDVTVSGIDIHPPPYVELAPIFTEKVTLPPHAAQLFPTTVKVGNQAQPGKQLILFDVALEGNHDGRSWEASTVEQLEVEVGIFGESEVLGFLSNSLPGDLSITILPGLLFVLTFAAMWRKRNPNSELFKDIKQAPEAIVIAIALSFAVAFLYPHITARFGERRDYLRARGFVDIAVLWIGSILLAVLFIAIIGFWKWGEKQWHNIRKRNVLTKNDEPLDVLEKLNRHEEYSEMAFPAVTIEGKTYLSLMPAYGDDSQVWCTPQILFRVNTDSDLGKEINDTLTEVEANTVINTVVEVVKEGVEAGVVDLSYAGNARPVRRERSELESGNDELLIAPDFAAA